MYLIKPCIYEEFFLPFGRKKKLQSRVTQLTQYPKSNITASGLKNRKLVWPSTIFLLSICQELSFRFFKKIDWQVGVILKQCELHVHSGERVLQFLADCKELYASVKIQTWEKSKWHASQKLG